jgi:hypothetical protein
LLNPRDLMGSVFGRNISQDRQDELRVRRTSFGGRLSIWLADLREPSPGIRFGGAWAFAAGRATARKKIGVDWWTEVHLSGNLWGPARPERGEPGQISPVTVQWLIEVPVRIPAPAARPSCDRSSPASILRVRFRLLPSKWMCAEMASETSAVAIDTMRIYRQRFSTSFTNSPVTSGARMPAVFSR